MGVRQVPRSSMLLVLQLFIRPRAEDNDFAGEKNRTISQQNGARNAASQVDVKARCTDCSDKRMCSL